MTDYFYPKNPRRRFSHLSIETRRFISERGTPHKSRSMK